LAQEQVFCNQLDAFILQKLHSRHMASSRTLTFAIAGTADIAKNKFIPAVKDLPGVKLVGVASRQKEKAAAFCKEHDAGEGMSYDELYARKDIDVVYVAISSGVRNETIAKCIAAGKHIYSEKPHGGTVAELKELIESCQAAGLQWMDGTMWYHSNRTLAIEAKLKELGKVKRVSGAFSWGPGLGLDEAWVNGGNGRTDKTRELHGMLGDSGHYPLSAILWAFNWKLPTKVQALHTKKNKVDTIIECDAFLWFPEGGVAILDTSCERPHRSQYEIVCEKGVVKVDDLVGGQGRTGNFGAYENPFVGSGSYILGDAVGKDEVVQVETCDHEKKLIEAFVAKVEVIKEGGSPDPDFGRRSLATHAVMCAIFESAENGGVVVEL
jgi:predicted dehydrogenase